MPQKKQIHAWHAYVHAKRIKNTPTMNIKKMRARHVQIAGRNTKTERRVIVDVSNIGIL